MADELTYRERAIEHIVRAEHAAMIADGSGDISADQHAAVSAAATAHATIALALIALDQARRVRITNS